MYKFWNPTKYIPSDIHFDTDYVPTQITTNTAYTLDTNSTRSDASTSSLTVRARVLNFIDECNKYYCPENAACEPCHSRIHILTDDGKNMSILPPTDSYSFENFHIVEGEEFIFNLSFTPYGGGLMHYQLIGLQKVLK